MSARKTAKPHVAAAPDPVNLADRLFDVGALVGAVQLQSAEIERFRGDVCAINIRVHAAGRVARQAADAIDKMAEELFDDDRVERLFDVGAMLSAVHIQLADIEGLEAERSHVSARANAARRVARLAAQAIFTLAEELLIGDSGEPTK